MAKLTDKQKRFVDEYLIDLNATQAAIRAGYSVKTARQIGEQNLSKLDIAYALEERKAELAAKCHVSQEYVLMNLKQVVEKSMQAEPVMKFDYDLKQMVETGEYVFDSRGANQALQLLGKHVGMFKDKVEHNGDIGIKIKVDYGDDDGGEDS